MKNKRDFIRKLYLALRNATTDAERARIQKKLDKHPHPRIWGRGGKGGYPGCGRKRVADPAPSTLRSRISRDRRNLVKTFAAYGHTSKTTHGSPFVACARCGRSTDTKTHVELWGLCPASARKNGKGMGGGM